MTVSAPVRLMPTPPLLVERMKAKMGRSKDVHLALGSMIRVAKKTQKTMIMLERKWMMNILWRIFDCLSQYLGSTSV